MKRKSICNRLESGKGIAAIFFRDDKENLIQARKLGSKFVVTWQQYVPGHQDDASKFSRDERHEFLASASVCSFLELQNVPFDTFKTGIIRTFTTKSGK